MIFRQYGTIELGDAVERSLTNAKWESDKIDNETYKVTVTGFSPNLTSAISVTFGVSYYGDSSRVTVLHSMVNGEYFDDEYSNELVLGILYS